MSNRSSGTLYAYIDDQYNTTVKEKARREEKKTRDKLRENVGYMSIWAYQTKEMY
jgi:hypothetical protein